MRENGRIAAWHWGRLAGDLEVGGVAAHLVWRCGGWEAGGATVGRGPTTEIEGPL